MVVSRIGLLRAGRGDTHSPQPEMDRRRGSNSRAVLQIDEVDRCARWRWRRSADLLILAVGGGDPDRECERKRKKPRSGRLHERAPLTIRATRRQKDRAVRDRLQPGPPTDADHGANRGHEQIAMPQKEARQEQRARQESLTVPYPMRVVPTPASQDPESPRFV